MQSPLRGLGFPRPEQQARLEGISLGRTENARERNKKVKKRGGKGAGAQSNFSR